MRVLYNGVPLLPPRTGVGRYVHHLCRALLEVDPALELAFWYSLTVGRGLPREDGPPAARMRAGAPSRLLLQRVVFSRPAARIYPVLMDALFRLRTARRRYDLYHETNYVPRPFAGPTVVTVYDLSLALYPETHPAARVRFFRRDFVKRLPRVDRFLAISRTVADELVERFRVPRERVRVTPLGVDRRTFRPRGAAEGRPAERSGAGGPILFVGSLEPRKDLPTLFRAYARLPRPLRDRHPLRLVGPPGWKFESTRALVGRLGLEDRVEWHGFVSEAELAEHYRSAALLALPSIYEGFGLPLVEAMASGAPVVCSDIPVFAEVGGEAALRVPVGDAEAWAAALRRVLSAAGPREEMSRAGLARAAAFTWRACAEETLAAYREVA